MLERILRRTLAQRSFTVVTYRLSNIDYPTQHFTSRFLANALRVLVFGSDLEELWPISSLTRLRGCYVGFTLWIASLRDRRKGGNLLGTAAGEVQSDMFSGSDCAGTASTHLARDDAAANHFAETQGRIEGVRVSRAESKIVGRWGITAVWSAWRFGCSEPWPCCKRKMRDNGCNYCARQDEANGCSEDRIS